MMANTEVIKEPRGFIKFIEFVLAIFAFATTTAFSGSTGFSYLCFGANATLPTSWCNGTTSFSYAFNLQGWSKPCCEGNATTTLTMAGNLSAPSQFYVFVGVMAFLYSLAAVLLYIFADDKYRQLDYLPKIDLVVTAIFVLFWLIASSAWADGLTKLKHYTDPNSLKGLGEGTLSNIDGGTYASLNVSIIFGFLNMVVWGGNIWFLYKETKWFSGEPASGIPPPQQQAGTPSDPQPRV